MFNAIKERIFRQSSEQIQTQNELEYVRSRVLAKFPLLGTTMAHLKTVVAKSAYGEPVKTASTDGEHVFCNPEWFMNLSDDERVFVYAHEVMHVAFNHIMRSGDRNHKIWNRATDAVINQMLKSENLPMPKKGVDIADAIQHSAEEMYDKLLRENKNKQGNDDDQAGHDDHNIWKKIVERAAENEKQNGQPQNNPNPDAGDAGDKKPDEQNNQSAPQNNDADGDKQSQQNASDSAGENKQQNEQQQNNSNTGDGNADDSAREKNFTDENRRVRAERAAQIRQQLNSSKNFALNQAATNSIQSYGPVGTSNAVADWRRLLKKSLDEERDKWSYRRSDADNDYMARVEEEDDDDRADIEVMLDTSGSISHEFLREFLRQLKPLLKNGKLRAGCFDERFYGFSEIKSNDDIDNFKFISRCGGTRLDVPVKSFSKTPDINKIIFTDGYCVPAAMPDASTKNIKNLIWLVFDNRDFHPVCGRVIFVDSGAIQNNFTRMAYAPVLTKSTTR